MMISRFELVAEMFADAVGVSAEKARQTIVNTETGRALFQDNAAYLYDSPLSNLSGILSELPASERPKIDKRKLVRAVNHVMDRQMSQPVQVWYKSAPELKGSYKSYLKKKNAVIKKQKAIRSLQAKRRIRRILNDADHNER